MRLNPRLGAHAISSAGRCPVNHGEAATSKQPSVTVKTFEQIPRLPTYPVVGTLPLFRIGPYSVKYYAECLHEIRKKYGPLVADYRGWGRKTSVHVFEPDDVRTVYANEGQHPNIEPLQETAQYERLVADNRGWGRKTSVHLFEPDDVRTVYANEGQHPNIEPLQETAQLYRSMRDMSLGLGNMNGSEWYRLRSAVQQAMMRPDAVRQYFPLVNQVAEDFVDYINHVRDAKHDGLVRDFRKVINKWTMETAGLLVFEKRLGALDFEGPNAGWAMKMLLANEEMFLISGKLKYSMPFFRYFATPSWRQLVETEDLFYKDTRNLINEAIDRMRQISTDSAESNFLFMKYLATRDNLSREDVMIIALSLFSDGLNTTSPILVYNLYNLAANPEKQRRLREELNILSKSEVNGEKLANAKYLNACIKESFRLYPIGPDVSRIPANDIVLSGYRVPAGTPCELNLGPANKDPANFKNPEEFRPERWLREDPEFVGKTVHPFILTPFGHGPRMCAGRRFAEQDLRVAIYHLIRAFDIGYQDEHPMRQKWESLLLPDGDCRFTFSPRNQ